MLEDMKKLANSVGLNKRNIFTTGALLGGIEAFPYFAGFIQWSSRHMVSLAQASIPIMANWFTPTNLLAVIVASQWVFHRQENERLEDNASRDIFENDRFWPFSRFIANSLLGLERYTAFSIGYGLPSTFASTLLASWGAVPVLAISLLSGTVVSALADEYIFARTDKAIIGNITEATQEIMNGLAAIFEENQRTR